MKEQFGFIAGETQCAMCKEILSREDEPMSDKTDSKNEKQVPCKNVVMPWVVAVDCLPTEKDADDFGEVYWWGGQCVSRRKVEEIRTFSFSLEWAKEWRWKSTGTIRPLPPEA